jgi:acyl-CoA reductase-like NAD-dependent aldehyde dehydrogenase
MPVWTGLCSRPTETHFKKILGYIKSRKLEGEKLLCGGGAAADHGYFTQSTIFRDVQDSMTSAKEIFRPVMQILKIKTIEGFISRANNFKCSCLHKGLRQGQLFVPCPPHWHHVHQLL